MADSVSQRHGEARGGLRGKALPGLKPRHARAERLDDSPAAGGRSERHRQCADDNDPERNLECLEHAPSEQRRRENAHEFLPVVETVIEG